MLAQPVAAERGKLEFGGNISILDAGQANP
jgi:hypothetical protein